MEAVSKNLLKIGYYLKLWRLNLDLESISEDACLAWRIDPSLLSCFKSEEGTKCQATALIPQLPIPNPQPPTPSFPTSNHQLLTLNAQLPTPDLQLPTLKPQPSTFNPQLITHIS